jgi:hypothetical protein
MTPPMTGHQSAQAREPEHNHDGEGLGLEPGLNRALPDTEPMLRALALRSLEVIAGARDLEQLARWVTDEVYAHLSQRASIAARARAITGVVAARPMLTVNRVNQWPSDDGTVNAVVVVYDSRRPHVVSLKLEDRGNRWRATVVAVL